MQLREFNNAHKRQIRSEGIDTVGPAEQALRELLPQLQSNEDRRVAMLLIARLPGCAVPVEPPSGLMQEAVAIERAAYDAPGTDAEPIASMAEAPRKIFEIADRAPADKAAGIRSLTRVLEHLEDNLRNPHWPLGRTETISASAAGRH
ncbi:hypothetical protein JOF29_002347 [Kribbella aluminosa]|uniref:Uncharacterized protein n=1 Tax=Kribbella aluminosa TaxID=416017 RepID=A0ABS4UIA5_9ACTN|nr:hypothetical protein [Kribbella aluminosa]MBP2351264.1 hypothetical protein [Kribbella aluminosa]